MTPGTSRCRCDICPDAGVGDGSTPGMTPGAGVWGTCVAGVAIIAGVASDERRETTTEDWERG